MHTLAAVRRSPALVLAVACLVLLAPACSDKKTTDAVTTTSTADLSTSPDGASTSPSTSPSVTSTTALSPGPSSSAGSEPSTTASIAPSTSDGSSSTTSSTPTPSTTTATTSPGPTTTIKVRKGPATPALAAEGLVSAWQAGDRVAAARFASAGAVKAMFKITKEPARAAGPCQQDGTTFACAYFFYSGDAFYLRIRGSKASGYLVHEVTVSVD